MVMANKLLKSTKYITDKYEFWYGFRKNGAE